MTCLEMDAPKHLVLLAEGLLAWDQHLEVSAAPVEATLDPV